MIKPIPMQVTFNVKLPALVKKEKHGRRYISWCPVLDVYSQGESRDKALSNLSEALRLFFVSCFDRGTLDQVLKECGFKPWKNVFLRSNVVFRRNMIRSICLCRFKYPRKRIPPSGALNARQLEKAQVRF